MQMCKSEFSCNCPNAEKLSSVTEDVLALILSNSDSALLLQMHHQIIQDRHEQPFLRLTIIATKKP
jgi:hypothetical protein